MTSLLIVNAIIKMLFNLVYQLVMWLYKLSFWSRAVGLVKSSILGQF